MNMEPRPYRDQADLEAMLHLLQVGKQVASSGYYVHPGDLSWWLFYTKPGFNPWKYIFLWEAEGRRSQLLGWALLSPEWRTFDVFVHPTLRWGVDAQAMVDWAEKRIAEIVRQESGKDIRTMWVAEDDASVVAHLERVGFSLSASGMLQYQRRLQGHIDSPSIPAGFSVRRLGGEREAPLRAEASHAVFESTMPKERYIQRYLDFMHSPVYHPEMDLVAVTPDERIAAFCIAWLDFANQVGLFEPVGVHPDFRRMGLGKAVLSEGMRRMMAYGMRSAIVCAETDNPAAQHLYQASGFQIERRLMTYVKAI